jgi:hypothetical protein
MKGLLLAVFLLLADAPISALSHRWLQGFGVGNLAPPAPTPAPTVVGTVPPEDSWEDINVTVPYRLFTMLQSTDSGSGNSSPFVVGLVDDTSNNNNTSNSSAAQNAINLFAVAALRELRILVRDSQSPVAVQRLESFILGTLLLLLVDLLFVFAGFLFTLRCRIILGVVRTMVSRPSPPPPPFRRWACTNYWFRPMRRSVWERLHHRATPRLSYSEHYSSLSRGYRSFDSGFHSTAIRSYPARVCYDEFHTKPNRCEVRIRSTSDEYFYVSLRHFAWKK